MNNVLRDLRYAVRTLLKAPGFTAVAVLTLALGIGANAAIFSVVNAVLLRPLPYPDPERLVMVWPQNLPKGWERNGVSTPDFKDYAAENTVFEHLAAFHVESGSLTGREIAQRIEYARVDANFFPTMGTQPLLGRVFLPEEDTPGRDNAVVIGESLWRAHFSADPSIIGKTLTLSRGVYTIVGVMPASFTFPTEDTRLWAPLVLANDPSGRGARWLYSVARLKHGISSEVAGVAMNTVAARLAQQYPETNKDYSIFLEPLHDAEVGSSRRALLILWGTAAFVLLIACGNVANLLLVRAGAREREMAIRASLGAGRRRLVRQLLTESLLLALAGAGAGLLLAIWSVDTLARIGEGIVPRLAEVRVDPVVFGFALALAAVTTLLFGLFPSLETANVPLHDALKEGGRSATNRRRHRARGLLVAGEIALAVIVLVGAGLLLRSFAGLLSVRTGFNSESVLTFRVEPPWQTSLDEPDTEKLFQKIQAERGRAAGFYDDLFARIRTLPGVRSVAAINRLPLSGNWWVSEFAVEGRPLPGSGEMPAVYARVVTPGYFSTMGIALLEGRDINSRDDLHSAPVAVIAQEAAERFFPGENPIGRRISFERPDNPLVQWHTIVGVVGDVRQANLEDKSIPVIYVPFTQARFGHFRDWGMTVVIGSERRPTRIGADVRRIVASLDRNLPVFELQTMEQVIGISVAERRFSLMLLGLFALLTLALAAVGIYGVVSYTSVQRTQEIGIRMAVGAQTRDILRLVVGEGMVLVLFGLVAGLAGALFLTRFMESMLFGIGTSDPLTLAGVVVLLATVALLACYIPARRAARVDPAVALRAQ